MTAKTVAHLRRVLDAPELPDGRYRLLEEIGRGGMGVVYLAHDTELDRQVALKVSTLENAGIDEERMRREARILAHLEHPGIVPVHDAGSLADGRPFYVMKLVRGERLDSYSRAPHSVPERLRLFERLCQPVAFAHAHGVVHCDLKPANIMVGEFGEVLVLDWGVAKVAGEPDSGALVGTQAYMAPEQASCEPGVDARADVYSLGKILRFLLDGQPLAKPLASICGKASAKNPADRYPSALELSEDIDRFVEGVPVSAHRENLFERAGRILAKNKMLAAIILAYLVMRAIVLIWTNR